MASETVGPAPLTLTRKDFVPDQDVRWCPGCGDYAILAIMQKTMPELRIPRENIVFISGIGCSSRFPYYMNTYGFHTIHGRAPAVATGLKMQNPELQVWVVTGDGDALSIGGNHLIHALRRNVDLKILLFNNRIYGLTKGQYSPTSEFGKKTKSSPAGSIDHPIQPISLALGAEATFVARTLDTDTKQLGEVLKAAAAHQGSAFVEIFQNCVIFNDDAFTEVADRKVRDEHVLFLENGKPLVFAGGKKGIRMKNFRPEVVTLGEGGITEQDLLVHDEQEMYPAYAYFLSQMNLPTCPVPFGIFRRVQRPTYERLAYEQIAAAERKKPPDLEALLNSGDTWTVPERKALS